MTNKEALKESAKRCIVAETEEETDFYYLCTMALKKQIPTKPIETDDNGTGMMCVNCGETLLKNWKPNYCVHCGQAIDWSSGDEDE